MNNEMETAPKKQVNKWKWSTIIVSIISVVTVSFMGFALFNQNQTGMNGPSNNQSQLGGTDESYGTPPSGGPGGTSDSNGDTDANSGASMNPDTDSSSNSSSNSI